MRYCIAALVVIGAFVYVSGAYISPLVIDIEPLYALLLVANGAAGIAAAATIIIGFVAWLDH